MAELETETDTVIQKETDMDSLFLSSSEKEITVEELNSIRDSIESMSKYHQVEILRLLNKCKDVTLNENKNGIHVNLSEIKKEIILKLIKYIHYVKQQESVLNEVEQQKEIFKNIYFTKDNKDTGII